MRGIWVDLVRPVTVLPVFVIALLFGAISIGQWPILHQWELLFFGAGLLTVAQVFSNILNECSDLEEDSVHEDKENRPITRGAFSPFKAVAWSVTVWLLCAVLGAIFIGGIFTVLYLMVLVGSWSYSFLRVKRVFPLNYLGITTSRGAVGIAAAWVILGSITNPHLWVILTFTVPLVLLGNEARNIGDADADRTAGVQTITVLWGEKVGRRVTAIGFYAPFIASTVWLAVGVAMPTVILVGSALIAVVGLVGHRLFKPKILWYAFYGALGLLPVFFFVGTFTPW